MFCNHKKQFIAIHHMSLVIHEHHPIAITIKRDAHIGLLSDDSILQQGRACGTAVFINIKTIRIHRHFNDFRAQLPEHAGSGVVGGAIGAVHNNFQTLEVTARWQGAFAELDIAAHRIVNPVRLA